MLPSKIEEQIKKVKKEEQDLFSRTCFLGTYFSGGDMYHKKCNNFDCECTCHKKKSA